LRRSSVLALLTACSVPLHEAEPQPKPANGEPPPPVVTGCPVFGGTHGGARSVVLEDGRTLFVLDDGRIVVASVENACAPTEGDDADLAGASPLGIVRVAGDVWLYTRDDRGFGVARLDPTTMRLAPATPLFTSDRPSFGTSAIAPGDGFVYAYGCRNAGFLRDDCFVARAPDASIADESAYRFYTGGGQWGPRVDNAWPIASAGTSIDVVFDPLRARYLMFYVPTLGSTVHVRSGLSPTGPWSDARALASCDATKDVFCSDFRIHAFTAPGVVATYARVSFEPVPERARTALLVWFLLSPDLP
jgi:hypothetical protein